MGNRLFGVDISGLIKANIGPGVLDAILVKVGESIPTSAPLTGPGSPTTTSYPCKGFIDMQRDRFTGGTLLRSGSRMVVLIGDTIDNGNPATAPAPGDRIIIESTTFVIPDDGVIGRDPAAATYECEVREQ